MAILQSTNVVGTLCVNGIAVGGGGKDLKYCCITASTTWTPPSDLVDGDAVVDAVIVGGGGGGGSVTLCGNFRHIGNVSAGGGGGGGGATAIRKPINITSTDACSVTIGAGGVGAVPGLGTAMCSNAGIGGCTNFTDNTVGGGGGGVSSICCKHTTQAQGTATKGSAFYNGSSDTGPGGTAQSFHQDPSFGAAGMYTNPQTNDCSDRGYRCYSGCNRVCAYAVSTPPTASYFNVYCKLITGGAGTGFSYDPSSNPFLMDKGVNLWGDHEYYGSAVGTCCHCPSSLPSFGVNDPAGDTDIALGNLNTGSVQVCNNLYKGAGAASGLTVSINQSPAHSQYTNKCACASGIYGNDGVVVLKWYE